VLAGVLLIGTLQSALRFVNVTSDVINIVVGALLVASIVSPSFLAWFEGKIPRAAKERASKAPAHHG
jgi:rhamnose transport system permease protein